MNAPRSTEQCGGLDPSRMTKLVATLGLLPAALSHAIGSDSQRPFAIVLVDAAYRSAAVALVVAAAGALLGPAIDPGVPPSDEALAVTGRADEFMI